LVAGQGGIGSCGSSKKNHFWSKGKDAAGLGREKVRKKREKVLLYWTDACPPQKSIKKGKKGGFSLRPHERGSIILDERKVGGEDSWGKKKRPIW